MKEEEKATSRSLLARSMDIGTEDCSSLGWTQRRPKVQTPPCHFHMFVFSDLDSCAVLYDFDDAAQSMRPVMIEFPRSTLPTDSKVRTFPSLRLRGTKSKFTARLRFLQPLYALECRPVHFLLTPTCRRSSGKTSRARSMQRT